MSLRGYFPGLLEAMSEERMEPMEQEFAEADRELQRMILEALDNCLKAGAPKDDLQFLAWQAGCGNWTPAQNVIQLRR